MNQAEFDENFASLTDVEKKMVALIVLGKTDSQIAQECHIAENSIRKTIEKIKDDLGIPRKEKGKRRSKSEFITFVLRYKRELLGNSAPTVVNPPEELPTEAEELDCVDETEAKDHKPELRGNSTPTVVNPSEELPIEADELDCVEETETFDTQFLGRGPAMVELDERFRNGAKAVLIWAGGGVGKTTLAREFFKARDFELVLELEMGRETQGITPVESVVEYWFTNDLQQESGREFGLSLRRLKEHLKTHRIGIFIDNLEPALDNGLFIEPHRQYVELLRVLTDPTVQSVTLITSRERLCESGVSIELFHLQGLDKQAWEQYFTSRKMAIDTSVLEQMHHAYGGNAKAMEILWGAIREDYGGDMAAYWRDNDEDLLVHRELEDLVTRQFKRLEGQNPQAYRLLCRMGCFRYQQDVPRVPRKALLSLLWDVSENPDRIIRALRDRALIECENGEYWLHPVIRAEAIARLRSSEDWERANRKAGEFWTGSVDTVETVQQALTAFEAYHHYLQNKDFNLASNIILIERDNSAEKGETLGDSFYRLGLLKPMANFIAKVVEHLDISFAKAKIYNIWGDIEWLQGNLSQSIVLHSKSKDLAEECLLIKGIDNSEAIKCSRISCNSIFNLALCEIDKGDMQESHRLLLMAYKSYKEHIDKYGSKKEFKEISIRNQSTDIDCLIFLAFTAAKMGRNLQAKYYLSEFPISVIENNSWLHGYGLLFIGLTYAELKEYDSCSKLYHSAIKFAQKVHYQQVEAKTITGLAELNRLHKNFESALSHHEASIKILDDIGAKCDLAEAYYQRGLTYQEMGRLKKVKKTLTKLSNFLKKLEPQNKLRKYGRQ